jgi:hypothetical protein
MSPNPVRLFSDGSGHLRRDLNELALLVHAHTDGQQALRARLDLVQGEVERLTAWQQGSLWQRLRWVLIGG